MGRPPARLPSDFHSSATFRVPSDEAFELDCVPAGFDGSLGWFAAPPSPTGAGWRSPSGAWRTPRVDFVVPSEIVAGIGFAVVLHVMIPKRVVGPRDSSTDVGADATAAVAAVDDFEVFASSEIVGSVGGRWVAGRRVLGWASARSPSGPAQCDYSRDVGPSMSVNSDVALRTRRRAAGPELVVVVSGTSDVHFVDNVEIFSVELAADAVTGEWIHSLVAGSCRSSCSVARNTPPAFVLDPADIQSCVVGS